MTKKQSGAKKLSQQISKLNGFARRVAGSLWKIALKPLLLVVGRILWTIAYPIRPLLRPIGRYLVGVGQEFKKVNWPKRAETWKLTVAVVVFSFVFAGFVVVVDFGLNKLLEKI